MVIPVGPAHVSHALTAVASVHRSSVPASVVLVADGEAVVPELSGTTVLRSTGRRIGPAATRNRGLELVDTPLVAFLDADDYFTEHGIEMLLRGLERSDASYVYGDAWVQQPDGSYRLSRAPEYDQRELERRNLHVVTAVCQTSHVKSVGGFDDRVDAWEDWTLWLRMAMAGHCGKRVDWPVFVYRVQEGQRMLRFSSEGRENMEAVLRLYRGPDGSVKMCGCNKTMAHQGLVTTTFQETDMSGDERVLVQYTGTAKGTIPFDLPSGETVRLADTNTRRYARLLPSDYEWLKGKTKIELVPERDSPEPPSTDGVQVKSGEEGTDAGDSDPAVLGTASTDGGERQTTLVDGGEGEVDAPRGDTRTRSGRGSGRGRRSQSVVTHPGDVLASDAAGAPGDE